MENIEFRVLSKADKEIKDLLRSTIYGKNGQLQYQHKNTTLRISQIKKADYCCYYSDQNELLANLTFLKREFNFDKKKYLGLYARFFSVKNKGNGLGKKLAIDTDNYYSESINQPALMHSYIEDKNEASLKSAFNTGCVDFGEVKTNLFSRFHPKNHKEVEIVPLHEKEKIKNLLLDFNKDKCLVTLNHLMNPFNYFVWKENGEIIAGIQGNEVNWKLINFPGIQGFLMLNVFPKTPLLKKLFQKDEMNFITFDHFYCKKGKEEVLLKLMESVLALFERNMAFYWLDTKDELHHNLQNLNKGGFISKIQNPPTARMICKGLHLTEKEIEKLTKATKFITAFDMT